MTATPHEMRAERLVRTAFWTLWGLTVALTTYGLAVELFGVGLFLRDEPVLKLHMRGEAHLATTLASVTAIGLAFVSLYVGRWSRSLCRLGFAALAFWLFYFSMARF